MNDEPESGRAVDTETVMYDGHEYRVIRLLVNRYGMPVLIDGYAAMLDENNDVVPFVVVAEESLEG